MTDLHVDVTVQRVYLSRLARNGFDKRVWPKSSVWLAEPDRGLNQVFRADDTRDARRQVRGAFPNAKVLE